MDHLLHRAIAGAAGGLAWFLAGVRYGRIRNNKYLVKGSLETLGGLFAGTFIVIPQIPLPPPTISFFAGAAWSEILQRVRTAITKRVERELSGSE